MATGAFRLGERTLDPARPWVMGVVNVTPDSFSDGGRFFGRDAAVDHAGRLVAEGADILDVGGESTRPGAAAVSPAEETDRVMPVVEALVRRFEVPVSVDTSKPEVMAAAAAAGAAMLNDVRAFRQPGAADAAARSGLALCVMHMQGEPRSMQDDPRYADPVREITAFLGERLEALQAAGAERERIVVDPGFGFGKSVAHNLALLRNLSELRVLGRPLLVGLSRKSLLGHLTGRPVERRLAGSIVLAALAIERGATIIRAHDVAETVDALRVTAALMADD